MLVIKDVKVHDDTHKVLKLLKAQNRSKSMDEVIRELVKKGTGRSVEQYSSQKRNAKLTAFLK
jgi:predicted CopG family antitoxin